MYFEAVANGYILRIRVTPNSSACAVSGFFTDCSGTDFLKINLTAVPEKGKANQELIKFLSKLLKSSKSSFSLISGETDRYKRLLWEIEPTTEAENTLKQLEKKG